MCIKAKVASILKNHIIPMFLKMIILTMPIFTVAFSAKPSNNNCFFPHGRHIGGCVIKARQIITVTDKTQGL